MCHGDGLRREGEDPGEGQVCVCVWHETLGKSEPGLHYKADNHRSSPPPPPLGPPPKTTVSDGPGQAATTRDRHPLGKVLSGWGSPTTARPSGRNRGCQPRSPGEPGFGTEGWGHWGGRLLGWGTRLPPPPCRPGPLTPPQKCQWTPHANGTPLSKEETWPPLLMDPPSRKKKHGRPLRFFSPNRTRIALFCLVS